MDSFTTLGGSDRGEDDVKQDTGVLVAGLEPDSPAIIPLEMPERG